jgi:hypothetical protein
MAGLFRDQPLQPHVAGRTEQGRGSTTPPRAGCPDNETRLFRLQRRSGCGYGMSELLRSEVTSTPRSASSAIELSTAAFALSVSRRANWRYLTARVWSFMLVTARVEAQNPQWFD